MEENETPEFDTKPAVNKDVWLLLILLDVVALCVLGFYLYKHFAPQFTQQPPAAQEVTAEVSEDILPVAEAVLVEEALESVVEEPAPAPEKKQSIIVAQGKSSKYRQVTFRWFGEGKSVSIVSGFTGSKPRKLQKRKDYWETTLAIAPGSYKFLYIIDGVNKTDPYAETKEGRSVLEVK